MINDKFILDEAIHDDIYEDIEEAKFRNAYSVEQPQAILLGGQMGAGKSTLIAGIAQEFPNDNFISISTDDLRHHHPQSDEIKHQDDKLYGQLTHPDASAWQIKLFDRSTESNRNICYEGTLQDAAGILNRLADLKDHGYDVTIQVVATHERFSTQGIYVRYESEKADEEYGRYVPQELHDKSYAALPETIREIEENGAADRIQIFDRSGNCIHDNRFEDGKWTNPGSVDALEKERDRELTPEQIQDYVHAWQERVINPMEERQAPQEEIDQIKHIAEHYCKQLERDYLRDSERPDHEDPDPPQFNRGLVEREIPSIEPGPKEDMQVEQDPAENRLVRELYDAELNQINTDLIDQELKDDLGNEANSLFLPIEFRDLPENISEITNQLLGPDRFDMLANPSPNLPDLDPEVQWIMSVDPEHWQDLAQFLYESQRPELFVPEGEHALDHAQDHAVGQDIDSLSVTTHKSETDGHSDIGLVAGTVADRTGDTGTNIAASSIVHTGPVFGYGVDTMSAGEHSEKEEKDDQDLGSER